ncbi:MAG: 4-alpha-glucanotransferase [Magnetococcus sp. WYHC-3]
MDEAPFRRCLPPVTVLSGETRELSITVAVYSSQVEKPLEWTLVYEDGEWVSGQELPGALEPVDQRNVDGRAIERRRLHLRPKWRLGYHRLELTGPGVVGGEPAVMSLIMAPGSCWLPEPLRDQEKRVWGFSVQLYALRSERNWGIGDYTDLARVVSLTRELGGAVVGLNPLHTLFPERPEDCSPYSPGNRSFLSFLYLDVEAIAEFAESPKARERVANPQFQKRLERLRRTELVDYAGVSACKREILELLFEHFLQTHLDEAGAAPRTDRGRAFLEFRAARGESLSRLTLFNALAEHMVQSERSASWSRWPAPFRRPDTPEVTRFARSQWRRVLFFAYLYWNADLQLSEVSRYAGSHNMSVGLYMDIALGVDPEGSDTWSDRELYLSAARAGAPPDPFNLKGQDWGLPPFHPQVLKNQGYRPFARLLADNMRHAGAVRLDHVMGLMRLFWSPVDGTPDQGTYVGYPFEDLIAVVALESHRNRCLVIGEALGTVPDGLRERLAATGVLSYRLLYFERDNRGDFLPPSGHTPRALIAATTHDLPTLRGFWEGVDLEVKRELALFPDAAMAQRVADERQRDRQMLAATLRRHGQDPGTGTVPLWSEQLPQAVYSYLAASPSQLLMVQLEDIIGQVHQVNMPGTVKEHPNWCRKLGRSLDTLPSDPDFTTVVGSIVAQRGMD